MTHIVLTVLGIVLVGLTLPLALELLIVTAANLLLGDKSAPNFTLASNENFKLAIIVPAHNEDFLVSRSVTSLRASAGEALSVLVVAHNCTDQTAVRATAAGAEALVYNDPAAVGKGFALRYGFAHALKNGADAVMVVDADSIVTLKIPSRPF